MQVIEITMGAEEKRPGAQQYSSDTRSAFVKLAVHPGDALDDVLAHGRDLLQRALRDAPTTPAAAPTAPLRGPRPDAWVVRVEGARAADARFRQLGMRWVNGEFIGEYPDEETARKRMEAVGLCGDHFKVRLDPPATGGV